MSDELDEYVAKALEEVEIARARLSGFDAYIEERRAPLADLYRIACRQLDRALLDQKAGKDS